MPIMLMSQFEQPQDPIGIVAVYSDRKYAIIVRSDLKECRTLGIIYDNLDSLKISINVCQNERPNISLEALLSKEAMDDLDIALKTQPYLRLNEEITQGVMALIILQSDNRNTLYKGENFGKIKKVLTNSTTIDALQSVARVIPIKDIPATGLGDWCGDRFCNANEVCEGLDGSFPQCVLNHSG
jgi:hypothetical protein